VTLCSGSATLAYGRPIFHDAYGRVHNDLGLKFSAVQGHVRLTAGTTTLRLKSASRTRSGDFLPVPSNGIHRFSDRVFGLYRRRQSYTQFMRLAGVTK